MSPVPHKNKIPKHLRWNLVQRGIEWADIQELARRILELDGQVLAGNHAKLIGHLVKADHRDEWLKIWVTIVQTLGLAYTAEEGKTIHATDIARYVMSGDSEAFFLFWALRFQFPHGYPKQKHYVENGVCVQPVVLLLEYLLTLEKQGGEKQRYLLYDEIINYCMRRSNHDANMTLRDVRKMLANRAAGYDYATERKAAGDGYRAVRQNLAARSKLYFAPSGLLEFQQDRIAIPAKAVAGVPFVLAFRKDPIPFPANTEEARNRYLRTAFACTPELLADVKKAFKEGRLPVKAPTPEDAEQAKADEWVQEEKAGKSKADLLAEAKKYVPGAGSKFRFGGTKVRLDDPKQKALIKQLEDFSCQIDGWSLEYTNKKGQKRRYIEAAHIQAKGKSGAEAVANIIILCPNCHKRFDFGEFKVDLDKKQLISKDGSVIPLHHDHHLFKE